ncbi:MAG TPA: hypothetical protein VJT73_00290 [Polyangiaceae bacterium]|nr:hypothetical protein [Polyangiaceae bacterium]
MHSSFGHILATLRDVDGVIGAFIISDDGQLVDKDLPSIFDASLFHEAGPRIVRLRDTLSSSGDEMEWCSLRFNDHKLNVRVTPMGFLCVISSSTVNVPALKMGVQLAQRRIMSEYGSLPPESAPRAIPSPPPSNPPSSNPPSQSVSSTSPSLAPPSWTQGPYSTTPPPPSAPMVGQESAKMYRGRPVK